MEMKLCSCMLILIVFSKLVKQQLMKIIHAVKLSYNNMDQNLFTGKQLVGSDTSNQVIVYITMTKLSCNI